MTQTTDRLAEVPFQREERYIVIKRKHLSAVQETAIRAHMARLNVGTTECVVVEHDWPENEIVWGMIERRVTGQSLSTDLTKAQQRIAELEGALNDGISTLAAVRATAGSDGWSESWLHFRTLCRETIANMNAALTPKEPSNEG